MTNIERQDAIWEFCAKWRNTGKEDADDHVFWIDILQQVLGAQDATNRIKFQKKVVVDGHTKKIDAYIPETKVLIEQKSYGIPLDKRIWQSDGFLLTPYEQAKRYNDNLPYSERARWIIVSNFKEFWIYDMNTRNPSMQVVKHYIVDLLKDSMILNFIVNNDSYTKTEVLELKPIQRKKKEDMTPIALSKELACAISKSIWMPLWPMFMQKIFILILSKIDINRETWDENELIGITISEIAECLDEKVFKTLNNRDKIEELNKYIRKTLGVMAEYSEVKTESSSFFKVFKGKIITGAFVKDDIAYIRLNNEVMLHLLPQKTTKKKARRFYITLYKEDVLEYFHSEFGLRLYLILAGLSHENSFGNRQNIPFGILEESLGIKESHEKESNIKQAIDDVNNSCCIKIADSEDDYYVEITHFGSFGNVYYNFEYITLFYL